MAGERRELDPIVAQLRTSIHEHEISDNGANKRQFLVERIPLIDSAVGASESEDCSDDCTNQ